MLDSFDPTTIEDSNLHQAFIFLLNAVEKQTAQIQALHAENQALRDEINHLKSKNKGSLKSGLIRNGAVF